MAIYGIGTDYSTTFIVWRCLWERFGEKFAQRILADLEWTAFQAAYCRPLIF